MSDKVDGINMSEYVKVFELTDTDTVRLIANIDLEQEALWLKWRTHYKSVVIKKAINILKESHKKCITECNHINEIKSIEEI